MDHRQFFPPVAMHRRRVRCLPFEAGGLPRVATGLEWQTPDTPPVHGNWGEKLPVVHRWAYDYSVPGVEQDFVPQTVSEEELQRLREANGKATTTEKRP